MNTNIVLPHARFRKATRPSNTKIKKNTQLFLEQFGLEVISVNSIDEEGVDGTITKESFLTFIGTKSAVSVHLNGLELRPIAPWTRTTSRIAYTVYAASSPYQLGWLIFERSHDSNEVQVFLENEDYL